MNVIIIGAGGQARVIIDILKSQTNKFIKIVGIIDKKIKENETVHNLPILGNLEEIDNIITTRNIRGVAIGVGDNRIRADYYQKMKNKGLELINAIHPSASIAESVKMGDGNVICREAVICTDVDIGNNTIINTGAIIEHECQLKDHTHIAPGVNIAGRVIIDEGSFIGIGSTIIEKIHIGKSSIVGAGSVVLKDLPPNVVAAGTPCKVVKQVSETEWFGDQQPYEVKEYENKNIQKTLNE